MCETLGRDEAFQRPVRCLCSLCVPGLLVCLIVCLLAGLLVCLLSGLLACFLTYFLAESVFDSTPYF